MKVLLTNVYSYKNKGDAAIVLALVNEINRAFNKPQILIQTADVTNDTDRYGVPVSATLLWYLLSSVRDKPLPVRLLKVVGGFAGLGLFIAALKLTHRRVTFVLSKDLQRFQREIVEHDVVIACGGGYLRTGNASVLDTLLLLTTCLNFVLPTYLDKKVYLYSQSIGPVYGALQRKILRMALNRVQIIESREDVTTKFLGNLELNTSVIETADPALLLGEKSRFPAEHVRLAPGRMHVGLTVRRWFNDPRKLEAYTRTMAKAIDHVIEKHKAQVFYLPQVIADNFGDDDRIIARRVHDLVKNKEFYTVIEADLHPYEMIGMCKKMHIFIGTRMHSNIFALVSHVPVVAIEYEHKTRGIMRGLGLEELTIDIKEINDDVLQGTIEKILKDRNKYANLIRENLPQQIQKSRSAIDAIKEDYEATSEK